MKKWKTIGVTALSTLALSIGGFTTYQYLQPTHYQGEVFNNEKTKQTSDNSFSSEQQQQQQQQQSSTSTTSSELFQSQVDTAIVPQYYKPMPWDEFSNTYHPQLGGTYMPTVITLPLNNDYAIINTKNPTDAIVVETTDNYTIAHERMQEAKDFANWVNSIAKDKPLQNSLQSNLQYYFTNVK